MKPSILVPLRVCRLASVISSSGTVKSRSIKKRPAFPVLNLRSAVSLLNNKLASNGPELWSACKAWSCAMSSSAA